MIRIKMWAAAVVAAVLSIVTAWAVGRREGKAISAAKAQEQYQATRRRMDAADIPMDPNSARSWLRERAKRGGL